MGQVTSSSRKGFAGNTCLASYFGYVVRRRRRPLKDLEGRKSKVDGRRSAADVGVLGEGEVYMFWNSYSSHLLLTICAQRRIGKEGA